MINRVRIIDIDLEVSCFIGPDLGDRFSALVKESKRHLHASAVHGIILTLDDEAVASDQVFICASGFVSASLKARATTLANVRAVYAGVRTDLSETDSGAS